MDRFVTCARAGALAAALVTLALGTARADDAATVDGGVADGGATDGAVDAAVDGAAPDAAAVDAPAPDVAPPPPEPAAEAPPPPEPEPGFLGLPGVWTSKGELGLDGRLFQDDDNPVTKDGGLGLQGRLELRHRHGAFDEKVRVFGRMDKYDEARSTLAWEEAFVQVASERVRLRAGLDIVNWTATEAFHPADVLNARNLDSDLENLEKLGEPMVALLARPLDETTITFYALPYRTEPIFSSPRSRLSFAAGFDLRHTRRMVDRAGAISDDSWGPQGAITIRQVIGPADITVHALEHMDRTQPMVRLDPVAGRPMLLFQTVRQFGGTYQHAVGALLVKLEGAYRHFLDPKEALPGLPFDNFPHGLPDHGQLALGLEWGHTHASGPESTFLLEGQTLLGVSGEAARAELSVFQRDVLAGYRLALNDEAGKELLLGAIFDTERAGEALFNVSYQQRLGETWIIRAGVRIFLADADDPGPLATLRKADHVRLTLTRHF